MRRDVCGAALVALALVGCTPDLVVGEERRLTLSAATQRADGRWRQAGWRLAADPADGAARLWYGTAGLDGGLDAFETAPVASAVTASAALDGLWVLAGHTTGDDGASTAWLRALGDDDGVRWTVTLPKAAGSAARVTAVTHTRDGALFVVGTEAQGGTLGGFAAKVDADGGVVWRHAFETEFQGLTRGFRPYAVAAPEPSAGSSRVQVFVAGERTLAAGVRPYALMMTLAGEVWDSTTLGDGGVGRGVAMDGADPVFCVEDGPRVRAMWPLVGTFDEHAVSEVSLGDGVTIVGCAQTPSGLVLAAQLRRVAATDVVLLQAAAGARALATRRDWTGAGDVTLHGLTVDAAGGPAVLGRSEPKLRRFWGGLERFSAAQPVR